MKLITLLILLLPVGANAAIPAALMHDFSPGALHENTIVLEAPDRAETINAVRIKIAAVKLPEPNARVTRIDFYSEHNLSCPISRYRLGEGGEAEGLISDLNLGAAGTVYVLAYLDNGMVLSGERRVNTAAFCCYGCSLEYQLQLLQPPAPGCITRF